MRGQLAVAVGLAALLAACSTGEPSSSAPSASATLPTLSLVALTDVEVVPQTEAAILAAFDAESAAALLTSVPASVDFGQVGVICVHLGERTTSGWAVDLQSASLVGGELQIRARETRPATGAGSAGQFYPAGCGTVTRAALPAGELQVRADDTVSEEFIVDGVITVPSS